MYMTLQEHANEFILKARTNIDDLKQLYEMETVDHESITMTKEDIEDALRHMSHYVQILEKHLQTTTELYKNLGK